MKRQRVIHKLALAGFAAFAGLAAYTPAFAANPYSIEYSGGQNLSAENVNIEPELINSLTALIGDKPTVTTQGNWQEAYLEWGTGCYPFSYVKVWKNNQFGEMSLKYAVSQGDYTDNVGIKSILIDEMEVSESAPTTVGVNMKNGWIFVGWGKDQIFSDAECTNSISANFTTLSPVRGGRMFVETIQKLTKKGESKIFTSNKLYYGITDIDAAQSYKIMNNGAKLTPENMFAKSATALQDNQNRGPLDPATNNLRNKFVANGNYIYSEYDVNIPPSYAMDGKEGDIYVKVPVNVQAEGLDVVYGFAKEAGSGLGYYAKQYNVKYKSDSNGKITDITDEDIISGNNPSGSKSTPNDGYDLDYWTVDKEVTLDDGSVIKANEPITMTQIKKVIVDEDLVFTAHHKTVKKAEPKPPVNAPDTGSSTGETNGIAIGVSIAVVALGALLVGMLPRLTHKKMTFKD